jgi:hypothetical protein
MTILGHKWYLLSVLMSDHSANMATFTLSLIGSHSRFYLLSLFPSLLGLFFVVPDNLLKLPDLSLDSGGLPLSLVNFRLHLLERLVLRTELSHKTLCLVLMCGHTRDQRLDLGLRMAQVLVQGLDYIRFFSQLELQFLHLGFLRVCLNISIGELRILIEACENLPCCFFLSQFEGST